MKLYFWNTLTESEQSQIFARAPNSISQNTVTTVNAIIERVKQDGDKALFEYNYLFDKAELNSLQVGEEEFESAHLNVETNALEAIQIAIRQVETYHKALTPENKKVITCHGVMCERQTRPIQRVGLYVPGGSAPLISTVIMLAVPARIACCPNRILCTPPGANGKINPYILVAAKMCGIKQVYKVGGAQAIAAMAYGTSTIAKVDKIFGPGNAWVTEAKTQVAQDAQGAAIDMPAGPSELLVLADENANPHFVAADLLSQAEHDVNSQVICLTTCEKLGKAIQTAVATQLATLPRQAIAAQALEHSSIIVVPNLQQAMALSNQYAPEHLILQVDSPEQYVEAISNAGTVFLGPWAPETLGDYVTGSNHVLPTYGFARTYSGLSIQDFIKSISFQTVTAEGLTNLALSAETLASLEGLTAHQRAVRIRMDFLKGDENV